MMAYSIFRPLYVTLAFTHTNLDYRYYDNDENAFGFNNCNFGIRSDLKKKTHNCSDSVK